jgi:hypothetical protein
MKLNSIVYRVLDDREKSISARDNFAVKTILAVSSIELTCCLLDKRDVREGLGGRHIGRIPLKYQCAYDKLLFEMPM